MRLEEDSPVNSSSSDDFAAFLDAELDSASDTSPEPEEGDEEEGEGADDYNYFDDIYKADQERTKRRKIEVLKSVTKSNGLISQEEPAKFLEASFKEDGCMHPGVIGGMCMKCGKIMDCQSGLHLRYIWKDLRLSPVEAARMREIDLKNLLRHRKLCLVLDLDHTLLNSTRFQDVTPEEGYLINQNDPKQDAPRGSLFKLDSMLMLTKLRPFVHTFLKEASNLFEMYIYTMGTRDYAVEMANLLDPGRVYFDCRVIAKDDGTDLHQKGLDVVLGKESAVVILDDTEPVWGNHKENLILMKRYLYFASSCKQFGYKCRSLSELKIDESHAEGALAKVLRVLKRIHSLFFDPEIGEDFADRDVRQVLQTVRKEVLTGCKIVFCHVSLTRFKAENHPLWKMAERMGAKCSKEVDPTVTHVISTDVGTEESRWAIQENKFLVERRWLEDANYFWQRQPEEKFPVKKRENK